MSSTTPTLQPGRFHYIGGTDKDTFSNVSLQSSEALLDDQDLFRVVNALQQAQDERAASRRYRLHGTLSLISFLTNKPATWATPQDLIAHNATTDFNAEFELCLGYTAEYVAQPTMGDNYYERRVKIITTGDLIDILPCGFAKNVFSEPKYNFMLNGDVNIADAVSTGLDAPWPVTEFVLYLRPRNNFQTTVLANPTDSNIFHPDTEYGFRENEPTGTPAILATNLVRYTRPAALSGVSTSTWGAFIYPEVLSLFRLGDVRMTPNNVMLNAGYIRAWADLNTYGTPVSGEITDTNGNVSAGLVYFDPQALEIREVYTPKYAITRTLTLPNTPSNRAYLTTLGYQATITGATINTTFSFAFEPFKNVPIRAFSEYIERGSTGDTAGIPTNAVAAQDGSEDLIWRDLLDPGYIEPSSGRGNAAPFVNGCHYIYTQPTFIIGPDLTNYNTFQAFRKTRLTLANPTFRL